MMNMVKMKRIKLFPAALAALLLASACTHDFQTKTFKYEDTVAAEQLDAECQVSCSFQYISGGVSQEVQDVINTAIVANHILYDEANGSSDVPAACEQWVNSTLESYRYDVEDFASDYDNDDAWMFNFEFSRTGMFGDACKSRHLQSYQVSYHEYTGGAHGMSGVAVDVFDMSTGEIIAEDYLFKAGYTKGVSELLSAALEKYLAETEEDPEVMFSDPEPNANFSVSDAGVTWIYNPYEIAPYALGIIELTVSWADLQPYLK